MLNRSPQLRGANNYAPIPTTSASALPIVGFASGQRRAGSLLQMIDSRVIASRQLVHKLLFVRVLSRQITQGPILSSLYSADHLRLRRDLAQFLRADEMICPELQFFAPYAAERQPKHDIALTPDAPVHSFNRVHDAPTFHRSCSGLGSDATCAQTLRRCRRPSAVYGMQQLSCQITGAGTC